MFVPPKAQMHTNYLYLRLHKFRNWPIKHANVAYSDCWHDYVFTV